MSWRTFRLIIAMVVILASIGGIVLSQQQTIVRMPQPASVASFADCRDAGGRIRETDPPRCVWDGQVFTKRAAEQPGLEGRMQLAAPSARASVTSPLSVRGMVQGDWRTATRLEVRVLASDGTRLGAGQISVPAAGTSSQTTVSGSVRFARPSIEDGTLVIRPANGPRADRALRVPIRFAQRTPTDELVATGEWETYRNAQFGFTLQHPSGWDVAPAPNNASVPMFNVYDPDSLPPGTQPPLTHHDRATHVSVYPRGIPTEGVFGDTIEGVALTVQPSLRSAQTFFTESGHRFATQLQFRNPPSLWTAAGFVWASARVRNARHGCERDGQAVPIDTCDPLQGDQVIWRGDVSTRDQRIMHTILTTLRFER